MIVGIRGRCRLEGESGTYMSLSNVKGALYSFSLRPRLFFPTGFYCYLARFLMRQQWKAPPSCDRHKGECFRVTLLCALSN